MSFHRNQNLVFSRTVVVMTSPTSFKSSLLLLAIFILSAVCRSIQQNQNWHDALHGNHMNFNLDKDSLSNLTVKHLKKRDLLPGAKRYIRACGRNFVLRKNKKIRITSPFNGESQYPPGIQCDWTFLGLQDCSPQIACKTIDLRKPNNSGDCGDEYLQILDGVKGHMKFCDANLSFSTPKRPAEGSDLFVVFKSANTEDFPRLFKGFQCEVSCSKLTNSEILPTASGLFKEDAGCECGKTSDFKSRIVGGQDATPFEYPWIVAIVRHTTKRILCGGSLINSRYVLTAAHCFVKTLQRITSTLQVLIHVHDKRKSDAEENTLRASISNVICHPFFGRTIEFDFDVCVLKLDQEVDIHKHNPICLPSPSLNREQLVSQMVTVAGWGRLSEWREETSRYLKKVNVPIVSASKCSAQYGRRTYEPLRMICAGYDGGRNDACRGDSGGPLFHRHSAVGGKERWYQLGVVSFGDGCARPERAGVYSYVPAMVAWIKRVAKDGTWCKTG